VADLGEDGVKVARKFRFGDANRPHASDDTCSSGGLSVAQGAGGEGGLNVVSAAERPDCQRPFPSSPHINPSAPDGARKIRQFSRASSDFPSLSATTARK
jgi:hypothetical protein